MINKIVLIDDDYSTNIYHEIILEESGIVKELEVYTSVDEAIYHLATCVSPPEIIFLDINMPVKSGWDFLKEYEELEIKRRAKHLIVLSTTKIPEEVLSVKNNQLIDDFFTKPMTILSVEKIINKLD